MKHPIAAIVFLVAATPFGATNAAVYDAPKPGDDVIGEMASTTAVEQDTLVDLGRQYNLGYREMQLANPDVDIWLPGQGTEIVLPTRYVLPDGPREGIVLNLAEMRLFYFPPEGSAYAGKVITYPLGIGREGWATPLGNTRITRTKANPTWTPPQSIKDEHAAKGDPLPDVVPAGPDNPLGQHALYLGFPTYLLHGTNKPGGIGLRVSHGCIRLYPEDVAALFSMVNPGTPVRIIDQPYKLGWLGDTLYIEAHPSDASDKKDTPQSHTSLVKGIIDKTQDHPEFPVDWDRAQAAMDAPNGIPQAIGQGPREPEKDKAENKQATGEKARINVAKKP